MTLWLVVLTATDYGKTFGLVTKAKVYMEPQTNYCIYQFLSAIVVSIYANRTLLSAF